jgi:hypothetical protein
MAQLKSVYFNSLPLAAHCRFDTLVSTAINNSSVVSAALGQTFVEYGKYLADEKAIEDWVRKSALTAKIKEADRRMDRAVTALRFQTRAQKYSPVEAIAAAANRVYTMLTGYGMIIRKPRESQIGDVQSVLRQFAVGGTYFDDASVLSLGTLTGELQSALVLFDALLKQRDEKSLLKPGRRFRQLRRLIEPVYFRMAMIINANALAGSSASYFNAVIDRLNPEIDRLNAEFHRVRRDIADAEPSPVPVQAYTGHPVTPLVEVLCATPNGGTAALVLGKDFNMTFRNNVDAGNAECTIHGKGAYKGRKTVTFIIARE